MVQPDKKTTTRYQMSQGDTDIDICELKKKKSFNDILADSNSYVKQLILIQVN